MEEWSDSVVHKEFKVSFYLDTNILSYLVDKTFSGLNSCFSFLSECSLVELQSSKYVIFEYVGIRKREHYLRKILQKNNNPEAGTVNLSSLLLYKEGFKSQDVDFRTAMSEISDKIINEELNKILIDFNITWDSTEIHSELWRPTFDLHLTSRISREDSLVLLSSTFPQELKKEEAAHILTNDERFCEAYEDKELSEDINQIFAKHEIKKPELIHITKFSCQDAIVNLTKREDDPRVIPIFKDKVIECILKRNESNFIGKTIGVPKKAPTNTICFELPANKTLLDNQYLVVIGKNLDFIYTTKSRVTDYRDNMQPLAFPYSAAEVKCLSFLLNGEPEGAAFSAVPAGVINRLREPGNFLFFHPDSTL